MPRTGPNVHYALAVALGQRDELTVQDIEELGRTLRNDHYASHHAVLTWLSAGRKVGQEFEELVKDFEHRDDLADHFKERNYAGWLDNKDNYDDKEPPDMRKAIDVFRRAPHIDKQAVQRSDDDDREWYRIKNGITMVKLRGAVGLFGHPWKDPYVWQKDKLASRTVQPFDIAMTKVTIGQFWEFLNAKSKHDKIWKDDTRAYGMHVACPVIQKVTWYTAAEFCNWLTDQENDGKRHGKKLERCYEPDGDVYGPGMRIVHGADGYRLPFIDEFEYACRAGSKMLWSCGDWRLLHRYCRYYENALETTWPVGSLAPNAFGLFDMHGNVQEMCHELVKKDDIPGEHGRISLDPTRCRRRGSLRLGNRPSRT